MATRYGESGEMIGKDQGSGDIRAEGVAGVVISGKGRENVGVHD
jgi:hypothetical protein